MVVVPTRFNDEHRFEVDTVMFDDMGKKYIMISAAIIPELKGDGGILSFSRSEITITVNDIYTLEFALHVKPPVGLYINGKPVVQNVLYLPTTFNNGYTYAVFFPEMSYKFTNNSDNDIMMVRSMTAMVAKCVAIL